ncbi:MAG: hypothetical protein HQ481_00540 [Alphaproteobacteria bacterium]|nr:hypothetical protein [Alphaproteobacteria bacterium]
MILSNMLWSFRIRRRSGIAVAVIAALAVLNLTKASDLIAVVCTGAGYDRLCEDREIDKEFCVAYAAGDMGKAAERVRLLRNPHAVLPTAHMTACRWLDAGERDAARELLNQALDNTVVDITKTERSAGALTLIADAARLQIAAELISDAERTMNAFAWIADSFAPTEEALLARAIAARDFAAIGEISRANALLDKAAATIDQVAEVNGVRPARYQAAFMLTQLAAEAGRWERAEVFLERLDAESPIIDSLDLPVADRDAIRRSERWLADVIATRVFIAPAN